MAGYLIFTYGLFTLNSLSSYKKRKVQEIRAYLNGNKKEGSLVGADYWSKKKVKKTKKSTKPAGQRENRKTISIPFLDKL